jgi:DNA primase large subunit
VLSHIESLSHRNLNPAQQQPAIAAHLKIHLPLSSNTARSVNLDEERRRDEIGHWVLRLAFCRRCVLPLKVIVMLTHLWDSPDLRARFVRSEIALFRHRFETDDIAERAQFLRALEFDWVVVDENERMENAVDLRTCMPWGTKDEQFRAESWFKVSVTLHIGINAKQGFIGALVYCTRSSRLTESIHKEGYGICASESANQSGASSLQLKIGNGSRGQLCSAMTSKIQVLNTTT